jgi:hypothetical protein
MDPAVREAVNAMLKGFWPLYVFLAAALVFVLFELYLSHQIRHWAKGRDKLVINFVFQIVTMVGLFLILGLVFSTAVPSLGLVFKYAVWLVALIVGLVILAQLLKWKSFKKSEGSGALPEKENCPDCGGKLVLRTGKYGKFLGCSNYPKCKHTKKLE